MRGARPQRAIEEAIERDGAIRRGERVLIACSGGPDSVALAAVLHAVAAPLDLALRIAHVNHDIRASAWQDECVALRIAAAFELPVDVLAPRAGGRDEAGLRAMRYDALLEAARRWGAGAVATAHHAEDQSETVLLALFRGTGPNGIDGMPVRRTLAEGIDLVRPLLRFSSETLRGVCHAGGLPYAVDPTNADTGLRRNAVREALDALRPLFPGLDRAIARAAALAGDEREAQGRAQLRRLVRARLEKEEGLRDVDFVHVEAAVRALQRGSGGSFHVKAGVRLEIEHGTITGITKA